MIGKDLFIANHRFQLKQTDNNLVLLRSHENAQTIGYIGALSLIFSLDLGEDPFLMPGAFQCGIVQSAIILFIIYIFSIFSFDVYFKTWVFGNVFSYGGIASIAISKKTTLFIEILLIISLLAISMEFSRITTSNIVDLLSIPSDPPSFLLNKWFIYYVVSALTAFPCLFYNSISSFSITSLIGNFCLFLTIIAFIVGFVKYRQHDIVPTKYFSNNYKKTLSVIACSSNLFFINPILSTIVINISRPTVKNIKNLVRITNTLSFIVCLAFGLIGYYFSSDGDDITDVFPKGSVISIITKIGIIIKVLTSNICYVYLISIKLCRAVLKGSEKWKLAVITSGLLVIAVSSIVQFSDFQKVYAIFNIIGLIFQCFLNFGFPTVLFLKLFQLTSKLWASIAIILMLFTILICICIGFYGYYVVSEI